MFNKFIRWLEEFFGKWQPNRALPPVRFSKIVLMHKAPKNEEVEENQFYLVSQNNQPKWALFKCPCDCKHVITLSLQKIHNPYWRLIENAKGTPTLYPSIWQKTECYSHFWIRDGRVFWCDNTGEPSPFW